MSQQDEARGNRPAQRQLLQRRPHVMRPPVQQSQPPQSRNMATPAEAEPAERQRRQGHARSSTVTKSIRESGLATGNSDATG